MTASGSALAAKGNRVAFPDEQNMREERKRMLIRYADSYLIDFHAKNAALRVGIAEGSASAWATAALAEGFFQRYLDARRMELAESQDLVTKEKILARAWQEAHGYGGDSSQQARVKALQLCARMIGAETVKHEHKHLHCVMRVPYVAATSWEDVAQEQQEALTG